MATAPPVLVEGAFDAIAITLAGDGQVYGVASCETALTLNHAQQLAAGSPDGRLILATHQDKGGRKAAEKDYWTITGLGLTPRTGSFLARTDGIPVKDPA